MKRKLLFLVAMLACATTSFAQFDNIGLLGGSTVTGWTSDTDMVTTDGVVYTLENVVIVNPESDGGVKFRKDDMWTVNWGGTGFPAGTASLNGANIPTVNGTYNVTFNLSTLQYSFEAIGFDEISLVIEGTDVSMFTADGVVYSVNNVELEAGDYAFAVNGSTTGWGGSGFPTGTATEGTTIPVPANRYNITFNNDTKQYMFNFVNISLIGDGVVTEDPVWVTDVYLSTTDGINYILEDFTFPGGEGKFRLNGDWNPGWGSTDFPSGVGSTAGDAPNIPIAAGTYDVTFNRLTGDYNFAASTNGLEDVAATKVVAYPNPTGNVWNFEAATVIEKAELTDITGKVVFAGTFNASTAVIDAAAFAPGIYMAKIYAGTSVQVIKVIKR
ncbi:T9SS type A sorting domain-containing protein [Flavobacterium sp.]|uniref:T9SS type A sorting domain-containing protein n=1 Tax=Flavobacterium sp. TaxID=239 RepID=UPI00260EFAFB|nr:T9SS type A sorting domain-containing protein [Flavobacterium sp.]